MARYWVVGGEYTDTSFERLAGAGPEERIGPFANHAEAKAAWQKRAWESVDNAHARYRIEEEGEDGAEPMTFWVVGGSYRDTHFAELAQGEEHWFGPFAAYEEARAEWQRRAWASVDDALARYRIEKLAGPRHP